MWDTTVVYFRNGLSRVELIFHTFNDLPKVKSLSTIMWHFSRISVLPSESSQVILNNYMAFSAHQRFAIYVNVQLRRLSVVSWVLKKRHIKMSAESYMMDRSDDEDDRHSYVSSLRSDSSPNSNTSSIKDMTSPLLNCLLSPLSDGGNSKSPTKTTPHNSLPGSWV